MSVWSVALCCIFAYGCYISAIGAIDQVSKGTWSVLNIQRCDNYEDYRYEVDIKRKRINRTHDAFDPTLKSETPVQTDHSFRADIDKLVDGGFKPYQKLADDSFCGFVSKHAGSNLEDALTQAGVDPPECPIPAGEHSIVDFIFNYEDLPEDGIAGDYRANIYLVEDKEDVGCVNMNVRFEEKEDE